jgi:hypothetical protein
MHHSCSFLFFPQFQATTPSEPQPAFIRILQYYQKMPSQTPHPFPSAPSPRDEESAYQDIYQTLLSQFEDDDEQEWPFLPPNNHQSTPSHTPTNTNIHTERTSAFHKAFLQGTQERQAAPHHSKRFGVAPSIWAPPGKANPDTTSKPNQHDWADPSHAFTLRPARTLITFADEPWPAIDPDLALPEPQSQGDDIWASDYHIWYNSGMKTVRMLSPEEKRQRAEKLLQGCVQGELSSPWNSEEDTANQRALEADRQRGWDCGGEGELQFEKAVGAERELGSEEGGERTVWNW